MRRTQSSALWKVPLSSVHALLGRDQEAKATLEPLLKEPVQAISGPEGWELAHEMYGSPFRDRAVGERYAEGLLRAGLPAGRLAGGMFPSYKEYQLTGDEIRRVLFERKIVGFTPDGREGCMDRDKNGNYTSHGPLGSDRGKTRIDGDFACSQGEKGWGGMENCAAIFRHPKGTYERKNEFLSITDWRFMFFSIAR
jgi:hypothetical protein